MRSAILSNELALENINVGHGMGLSTTSTPARMHQLSSSLIVSLTSWVPRFSTLYLTIRSLLKQTVKPDRIIVWIAQNDIAQLPDAIWRMAPEVEIIPCADIGSFKKLVFCAKLFPECFILTADDDVFYTPTWIEDLEKGVDVHQRATLCHYSMRMHRVDMGAIAEYSEWTYDPQDRFARQPSNDLLPIGVGGVLYPPGSLSDDIGNESLFSTLAPHCDDFWFYAMTRLTGFQQKKVGRRFKIVIAPGSQASALSNDPKKFFARNDSAVRMLESYYGKRVFGS